MAIWYGIKRRVERKMYQMVTIREKFRLMINGVKYGVGLSVRGRLLIMNQGKIIIGTNVIINSSARANFAVGGITSIQVGPEGMLSIGNNVGVSNVAITAFNRVVIHDNVMLGAGVKIYDTDFHPVEAEYRYGEGKDNKFVQTKAVEIKSGAFIGADTIVLKGVTVGSNAVVGAGSVVTHTVPDNEVWAGNPARFIKRLKDECDNE